MIKVLNSKISLAVLAGLLAWLGIAVLDIAAQKREISAELRDRREKVAALERENDYLARFAEYFKSPAFLEKEARLKLNYKAEGEEVVFVYKEHDQRTASASEDRPEGLGFWGQVKRWLDAAVR